MPKNVEIQGKILTIKIPERVIAKDLGWLGEQEIEQKVTVFMIRNFSNLRYFEDVREYHKKRLPNDLDNAELVGLEVKVPYAGGNRHIDAVFQTGSRYYVIESKRRGKISRAKQKVITNTKLFAETIMRRNADKTEVEIVPVIATSWKGSEWIKIQWTEIENS